MQHYTNQLAKETNKHLKELGSLPQPQSPSEQVSSFSHLKVLFELRVVKKHLGPLHSASRGSRKTGWWMTSQQPSTTSRGCNVEQLRGNGSPWPGHELAHASWYDAVELLNVWQISTYTFKLFLYILCVCFLSVLVGWRKQPRWATCDIWKVIGFP